MKKDKKNVKLQPLKNRCWPLKDTDKGGHTVGGIDTNCLIILEHGANVIAVDNHNETVLLLASRRDAPRMSQLFKHKFERKIQTFIGQLSCTLCSFNPFFNFRVEHLDTCQNRKHILKITLYITSSLAFLLWH